MSGSNGLKMDVKVLNAKSEQEGPLTSTTDTTVELVRVTVHENPITIQELADNLNLSFGSVQLIRTENLGMRRVLDKFVRKVFTADRVSAARI